MILTVDGNDLSALLGQAQAQRFGDYEVRFQGLTIFCHDLAAFHIAAKDIFVQRIYDFQHPDSQHPNEGPRVIDAGGHIGMFSLYVKKRFPRARVTAFEPDGQARALFEKNLAANGFSDVEVVPAGLWTEDTELSFDSRDSDGSTLFAGQGNTTVPVVRLSPFLDQPVDALKMNIEGAELPVLRQCADKLGNVAQILLEYHDFPELGQNLHPILALFAEAGFRYMIHDFDAQTNPFTKPPMRLAPESRYYLLVYAKRMAQQVAPPRLVDPLEDLGRLEPVSRKFGLDRSGSICRHYIEAFLARHAERIRGSVLEIAESTYTKKFGANVTESHVFGMEPGPGVTLCGDLVTGQGVPDKAFDCIILTQTLQVVFDMKAMLENCRRALKPGGALLATVSGISQISRYDMDRWGEFWRVTDRCLETMLKECFGKTTQVETWGNLASAKAYLDGRSPDELPREVLNHRDPDYQCLVTGVAIRGGD